LANLFSPQFLSFFPKYKKYIIPEDKNIKETITKNSKFINEIKISSVIIVMVSVIITTAGKTKYLTNNPTSEWTFLNDSDEFDCKYVR
jgi:predicted RND superfamily exporter protein|tara:strand:- start:126 stop:389 length:264 start_codon:yes stop_codon:yes gene_type:complete